MIEFHKIWIEQCEAAQGIKEQFGLKKAAGYLIGEKLLEFVRAANTRPEFAREIPDFISVSANRTLRKLYAPAWKP